MVGSGPAYQEPRAVLSTERLLIEGARLFPMTSGEPILDGDLAIDGETIVGVGQAPAGFEPDLVVQARGDWVLPGFVQGHVHLCQTVLRGAAEDRSLLDWLKEIVWPGEAAHDEETLRASTRLGILELIDGGVTALVDMGTVNHHHVVCEELIATGIDAVTGKAMMDFDEDGVTPSELRESTRSSIDESVALAKRFHGSARLRYAFCPRFALSCTRALLEEVAEIAARDQLCLHTHASENRTELELVRQRFSMGNLEYLDACGLLGPNTVVAHVVHQEEGDAERLRDRETTVAHCPAANLKLGSGISALSKLHATPVKIALGSDGAPCNNRLDTFREMYLAASLSRVVDGPYGLTARQVLALATREGARALGFESCGVLEPGARANIQVIDPHRLAMTPVGDPYAALVFSGSPTAVRSVMIGGQFKKRDFAFCDWDLEAVLADANAATRTLLERMNRAT